jgi:hypothetical protein
MAAKPKPPPDDRKQSDRFSETARRIGVDETGKAFERALKKIARKKRVPARPK